MDNATNATSLMGRHPDILAVFAPAAPMAEKIIPPIWYFIGFIGNPLSAFIWLGQRMRRNNSSAIYLGVLSVSDMLFLFLHLLVVLHQPWGYDVYNSTGGCEIFHFIFYIPQYLSTFLVLGFTAERYVAVCHPFLKEKLCTVKGAIIIVMILIGISTGMASAQIYIWTYIAPMNRCNIRAEAMEGQDESFWNIWTLTSDIFAFVVIPLLVLVFNGLVLKEIFKISKNDLVKRQQNRGGGNTASTVTLLSVSFYLIVTQISATILVCIQPLFPVGNFYLSDEEVREDSDWSAFFTYIEVRKIVEVICLSHYAVYFFIYCLTGKHFRKEVIYLLTFHGRVPFLTTLVSRKKRNERYSMVSTNGGPMSETYATNMSTTM